MKLIHPRRAVLIALIACSTATGCDWFDSPTGPDEPLDCSVFPPQDTSHYTLPWSVGESYMASPHLARGGGVQRFAIDFRMPIGTSVVAARSGIVRRVTERFFDGDHTPGHENVIFVEHPDGTTARYIHLTHDGALVEPGEPVSQGQVIGRSGDTGNSSEPHTHFDVTRCCCITPPDYNDLPCGQTLPLTFRNTRPHACGLVNGEVYTADPF